MDSEKAEAILKKIKWLDYRDFSLDELNENIDILLNKNPAFFSFSKLNVKSASDKLASLPVMLMSFISDERYTNELFLNVLEKYDVKNLLGKCFSAQKSHLLSVSIYYKNFELFNYFLDNHTHQFNLSHQNTKGETVFHGLTILEPNDFKNCLEKLFNQPHFQVNVLEIKNNKNQTAYDLLNDKKREILNHFLIMKERDELNKTIKENLNVSQGSKFKI